MKRLLFLSAIFISIFSISMNAGTQKKYSRKSISSLNKLIVYGNAGELSANKTDIILKRVKSEIELARFDYNILPAPLIAKFVDAFGAAALRGKVGINTISRIMEETVLPAVVKILNSTKELRAKANLTEEERNRFIAIKAKESGISAKDLMNVLNSAYIYIPYLKSFSISTVKVPDIIAGGISLNYSVQLAGGILWYKINYRNNEFFITLLKNIPSIGSGMGKIGKSYKTDIGELSASDYAVYSAAGAFGSIASKRTKELEEFKLYTPVMEYVGGELGFHLGTLEGIKLDNRFFIKESALNKKGRIERRTRGYFRISKVADNRKARNALSKGSIIRGYADAGMTIAEKPLLGVIIQVSGGVIMMTQESNAMNAYYFYASQDKKKKIQPVIKMQILYDIAPLAGTTLFFGEIGAAASYLRPERRVESLSEKMNTFLAIPYIGFEKKFQWREIALGAGAGLEIRFVKSFGTLPDFPENTFTILQKSYSAYAKADLIYSLGITSDFYVGLTAHAPNLLTLYTVKYNGAEIYDAVDILTYEFTGLSATAGLNFYF